MTSKMRFRCLAVFLLGFFVCSADVSLAGAKSVCDHVTLEWIRSQVPVPEDGKVVYKKEQGILCEAVLSIEGGLAPIYAGKDFILAGGWLYKNGESVTRKTMAGLSGIAKAEKKKAKAKKAKAAAMRQAFLKAHVADLADLVSLRFAPGGSSDKFVYVISDPACSHCKALLDDLEEVAADTGIALKLVIYPIMGKTSESMTAHAICQHLNYSAYKTLKKDDAKKSCEQADQRIKKTVDLFEKADISFVPLVVAQDGSWVVEGSDVCQVREHLGLATGTGKKGGGCKKAQKE